ncbi:hypothetical protein K449DRAFT_427629 [Hypoxylon sp. EC38]|nr:hypothetical protein K449DRAFT_427629 [Hypoxylon sp. EC38]
MWSCTVITLSRIDALGSQCLIPWLPGIAFVRYPNHGSTPCKERHSTAFPRRRLSSEFVKVLVHIGFLNDEEQSYYEKDPLATICAKATLKDEEEKARILRSFR